jgi:2-dehydro-3-deoxy-D-arabinonate dehydratase
MVEEEINANQFGAILQVIGVAYTYQTSLAVRHHLTKDTSSHHSSKHGDFSYFYKGNGRTLARHEQELNLRTDPITGQLAKHWPEPELAILLGERHEILAYTLANDLTAITIETRGRTEEADGTFIGKVWYRSGSLGPQFVSASNIGNPYNLMIGLLVVRQDSTIYNGKYCTSRRLRSFNEIPDMVVACYKQFKNTLPPSKRIIIGKEDFLPAGTVIMLGTGLIVQKQYFCEPGDRLTVYCSNIGELTNTLRTAISA